ncbi:MAG: hypothetical protein V4543_00640 [Bacteroidota bacterium]
MGKLPNSVPVTGTIAPYDEADKYPVTDPTYGIDGLRSVANAAARNEITAERRRAGMLVYTRDSDKYWKMESDLVTWTEVPLDGITEEEFQVSALAFAEDIAALNQLVNDLTATVNGIAAPDLSGLATNESVAEVAAAAAAAQADADALEAAMPGLATAESVAEAVAAAAAAQADADALEAAIPGLATAESVAEAAAAAAAAQADVDALESAIPDISGLATSESVSEAASAAATAQSEVDALEAVVQEIVEGEESSTVEGRVTTLESLMTMVQAAIQAIPAGPQGVPGTIGEISAIQRYSGDYNSTGQTTLPLGTHDELPGSYASFYFIAVAAPVGDEAFVFNTTFQPREPVAEVSARFIVSAEGVSLLEYISGDLTTYAVTTGWDEVNGLLFIYVRNPWGADTGAHNFDSGTWSVITRYPL